MMIAATLLRFALDLPERKVLALLEDGWGVPLAQSTLSRLTIEGLVRWQMLVEERLPRLAGELAPLLLQIDGTMTPGAPVTFRARHAITGATLWAMQLEVESKSEVVRFLHAFQARYGNPTLVVRDLSPTLREAVSEVFPGVPQQEDHFHFLADLGPEVLVDYELLRKGLLAGEGLAHLAQWSRKLPAEGSTLEELERVWVRLALEWVEEGRLHPGGFPFRCAYAEVVRRLERVAGWAREILRANLRHRVGVAEVRELKERVERLLGREGVRVPWARLQAELVLWEEVRRAMRVERDRRGREDLCPLTPADVTAAKEAIAVAGSRLASLGDWAEAIWGTVSCRFEEHGAFLWVEAPALGVVVRSTVELERAHREDRRGIRHRQGSGSTGEEMGRLGTLLAYWSNVRCPWFVENVLPGLNLWEEYARQDPKEVQRRMTSLPREGRRPKVDVPRKRKEGKLAELVSLLQAPGPLGPGLTAWAATVGSLTSQAGSEA